MPEWDDRALFEKLILDGFQAGLAWITILRKREAFRRAFDGFKPEAIVRYDEAKVARLMADAGIVRNRAKILNTITTARFWLAEQERGGFGTLLWSFVDGAPNQNAFRTTTEVPVENEASRALAKHLKAQGLSFCGPTILYAFMQAVGMVNDHLVGCFRHEACHGMSMTLQRKPRAWQRMLSGRRLDLLDPHPDDIAIEDIAHGLARVARWNGQTAGPHIFSVAQHALLVEAIFTDRHEPNNAKASLAALLHDAAEYVVGDLISPFKVVLGETYKAIELRVLTAVQARFDVAKIAATVAGGIKSADQMAARLEASGLAGFSETEATLYFGAPSPEAARWHHHLAPLPADLVQEGFLMRFTALMSGSSP